MERIGSGLFAARQRVQTLGMQFDTCMTVAVLGDGELLLHSPIAPTPALLREITALGTPRYIVAPNNLHRWYFASMARTFPQAATCAVSSRLDELDLQPDILLDDPTCPLPTDSLDWVCVQGLPVLSEAVLYHRESKMPLITDLCFHWGRHDMNWAHRAYVHINGGFNPLIATPFFTNAVTDRPAITASLDRILQWEFDAMQVCHTRPVLANAKTLFRQNAYEKYTKEPAFF